MAQQAGGRVGTKARTPGFNFLPSSHNQQGDWFPVFTWGKKTDKNLKNVAAKRDEGGTWHPIPRRSHTITTQQVSGEQNTLWT